MFCCRKVDFVTIGFVGKHIWVVGWAWMVQGVGWWSGKGGLVVGQRWVDDWAKVGRLVIGLR